MHRVLEYSLFFIALMLLQAFLFNNLSLSVYISPLVYVAFIILLPMETPAISILMLGLLTGITTDFLGGTAGINTIASLFTAFCRPKLLTLVAGKEVVADGGIPGPQKIGIGKFLRYCSIAVLLHCTVFFCFETMGMKYFHLTLLKILLSAVVTIALVYFSQLLLPGNHDRKTMI